MTSFFNRVKFSASTTGTADFGIGSALTGFRTPAGASISNGAVVSYSAELPDRTEWETGVGTYNTTGPVLERTTVLESSNSDAKVNFSSAPRIALTVLAQDIDAIDGAKYENVVIQVFTSSGTYTPTTGMKHCIIECLGGGGGGGGAASASSQQALGGGGGAGSCARKRATAADIGASQTVTIGAAGAAGASGNNAGGAGGDTSVGTLCIGKGGSGGLGATTNTVRGGAAGGVAGTGDFTPVGEPGNGGTFAVVGSSNIIGSRGGSSPWGGGGQSVLTVANGNAAVGYGSGGGGGAAYNGSNQSGAAGTPGIVIITEFIA